MLKIQVERRGRKHCFRTVDFEISFANWHQTQRDHLAKGFEQNLRAQWRVDLNNSA
jgi:hypothetical protein